MLLMSAFSGRPGTPTFHILFLSTQRVHEQSRCLRRQMPEKGYSFDAHHNSVPLGALVSTKRMSRWCTRHHMAALIGCRLDQWGQIPHSCLKRCASLWGRPAKHVVGIPYHLAPARLVNYQASVPTGLRPMSSVISQPKST
jgi:hypothetical protein